MSDPEMFCLCDSQDKPIIDFVRKYLHLVRGGMYYLQIAGGNGIDVIACFRPERDQCGRIKTQPSNLRHGRSSGKSVKTSGVPVGR